MSYQALYRKWRPDTFEDVKGQDHIVTTLKNQILADRIGHAYLFCGTRGTGKTSVAKRYLPGQLTANTRLMEVHVANVLHVRQLQQERL